MLTPDRISQLASLLRERENTLRAKIHREIQDRLSRDTRELQASTGDDSEQSTADAQEELDTGALTRDADELLAIEAAQGRMRDQSYGRCVACHGAIGFKRLLALPIAQRCLACQEHQERAAKEQLASRP